MAVKIKIIREESKKLLEAFAEPKRPPADYEKLMDFRRTQWVLSTEEIFSFVQALIMAPDSFRDKLALLFLPGVGYGRRDYIPFSKRPRISAPVMMRL